jgi:hypothetical protein
LVVLTILQNISQWEGLSHILWKIKNVWNHQPVLNTWKPNWSGGVRNHLCSVSLPGLSNTWGFTMGFVMIYGDFPAIDRENMGKWCSQPCTKLIQVTYPGPESSGGPNLIHFENKQIDVSL